MHQVSEEGMNDITQLFRQLDDIAGEMPEVDSMIVIDPQTLHNVVHDWINDLPGADPAILHNGMYDGMTTKTYGGNYVKRDTIKARMATLLAAIRENAQ